MADDMKYGGKYKGGKKGGMKYKGGKGKGMHGPLYTPPGNTLGPEKVEGPRGGVMPPDPLGYKKGGSYKKGGM